MCDTAVWRRRWGGGTFEVQVAGSVGVLRDGVCVYLECVHVAGVARHHHVVPLVVVERLVRVAFHQRRAVAQVEHIVDVAGGGTGGQRWVNQTSI